MCFGNHLRPASDFTPAGTQTEKLATSAGGRRALIVFSDGEDNSSAHHMMDAIETAQIADTRVLERIARETGGADFDAVQGDVRSAFRQIGEEMRSSCELAPRRRDWRCGPRPATLQCEPSGARCSGWLWTALPARPDLW